MIVVTAANGQQGKLLIPKLVAAKLPVRAVVRTELSAKQLRAAGVKDILVGDCADSALLARAMEGAHKVYHLCPTAHPKQKKMGFATVDAARKAGVRHFVYSTVLHTISTAFPQHEMMRDVEEYLLSSGLEYTILQPANYMGPGMATAAFEHGVFGYPFGFDRYQSLVDLEDVTDVAAMVLEDGNDHLGATYELAAPGRYTAHNMRATLEKVSGGSMQLVQIDAETVITGFFGEPKDYPHETHIFSSVINHLRTHDFPGNANVLTWLLGREPNTFEDFVRREWEAFRSAGSQATNGVKSR